MKQLHGLRILNTRPQQQAAGLTQLIETEAGIVVSCPTIEIQATQNNWVTTLPDLNTVSHAIFISANAVNFSVEKLYMKQHWPGSIHIIAIGESTAKALNKFNIKVHDIPSFPDSEHLLKLNSLRYLKNQTVLLFKGCGGRILIEKDLIIKGAQVIALDVYRRTMPKIDKGFLNSIWRDDMVDIILLTSEQSIRNLFKMFPEEALTWLQNKPCLVISKRLAEIASKFGIKKIITSHPNRMMNTLFDYNQGLIHGQQL